MALMRFVVLNKITSNDELKSAITQCHAFQITFLEKVEQSDPEVLMIGSSEDDDLVFEVQYFDMGQILIAEEREFWPSNASELLKYSGIMTLEIFEKVSLSELGNIYDMMLAISDRYKLFLLTEDNISSMPNASHFQKYF